MAGDTHEVDIGDAAFLPPWSTLSRPRKAATMTPKNTSSGAHENPESPDIDVEQAMALIEKGQQLAGHYPSAGALDSARRILTGELSAEDAEIELNQALALIMNEEHDATKGR